MRKKLKTPKKRLEIQLVVEREGPGRKREKEN
jgi:hypothetical protein